MFGGGLGCIACGVGRKEGEKEEREGKAQVEYWEREKEGGEGCCDC